MNAEEARDHAIEEARKKYNESTHKAWVEYEKAWKPLREKWLKASQPHYKEMQQAVTKANEAYFKEISNV